MACAVCSQDLTDPRLLPCLHSFCRSCIDRLALAAGPDNLVRCPSCPTLCLLPIERGAAELPRDSTQSFEEDIGRCDLCWTEQEKQRPSEALCIECDLRLCEAHLKVHVTVLSQPHFIRPFFGERRQGPSKESSASCGQRKVHFQPCSVHGEPLIYFCVSCDTTVCGGCGSIGLHRDSEQHRIVHVSDVMEQRTERSAAEVQRLKSEVHPCLEAAIARVDNVSVDLLAQSHAVRTRILSATQRVVLTAQAYEQQLLEKVDEIQRSRLKGLHEQRERLHSHLVSMKNVLDFSERLATSGLDRDKRLAMLVALELRAKALNGTHIPKEPRQHANIHFQEPDECSGLEKVEKSFGSVSPCNACPLMTTVERRVTSESFVDKGEQAVFVLQAVNKYGGKIPEGGDHVSASCRSCSVRADALPLVEVDDLHNGRYEIRVQPREEGEYFLEISINGLDLPKHESFICASFGFDPAMCNPNIMLGMDRRTATRSEEGNHSTVLGNVGMRRGQHRWTVKIGYKNWWYLLGVAAKPLSCLGDTYNESQSFRTSCKDANTHDGAICISSLEPLRGNDTVQLDLDCDTHTLCITNLRDGTTAVITDLPKKEYFAYFDLYESGNSIQLIKHDFKKSGLVSNDQFVPTGQVCDVTTCVDF